MLGRGGYFDILSASQLIANQIISNGNFSIPIYGGMALPPIQPAGSIIYYGPTNTIYASNGTLWAPVASTALPPSLQSIAGLSTSGNEIIYTIATNTYATTLISPAGRSFISAGSQLSQQNAIGLVPGLTVQSYSSILDSVVSVGNGAANNILYSTGSGLTNTSLSSFIRTNILPSNSLSALRSNIGLSYLPSDPNGGINLSSDIIVGVSATQTLLNKTINASTGTNTLILGTNTRLQGIPFSTAGSTTDGNVLTIVSGTIRLSPPIAGGDVVGPVSATVDAIPRYNTSTSLKNSGVTIDNSNNISGAASITSSGTISANIIISSTTIFGLLNTPSQTNITDVGALNSLVVNGITNINDVLNINKGAFVQSPYTITLVDQPTNNNDAANKLYVDNKISSSVSNLVTGPGSASFNAIARYNTNLTFKNSGVIIDDSNNITGVASLISTGNITGVNIIGNISTPSQTSITTVGTLLSLTVSGSTNINGALTINNNASVLSPFKLTLVDQPTSNNHAANKIYVDNHVSTAILNLVTGPVSATLNTIAKYSTNTTLKNSGVTIDDSNNITGVASLISTGNITGATISGTINTSSQTSITTVGTLLSLAVSGITTLNGALTINNDASIPSPHKLTLGSQPTSNNHAANKIYVDNAILAPGFVVGPSLGSTSNAIVRYDMTSGKLVKDSGVIIDDSNAITGVASLTTTGNVNADTVVAPNIYGTIFTTSQPNITSLGNLLNLTVSGTTTLLGSTLLNGGAVVQSGQKITLVDQPTNASDAANKVYVDNAILNSGTQYASATGATTTVLPNTPTYTPATGKLTATGGITTLTIDGVSYTANDGKRVVVKNQVDARQNGIYTRTTDNTSNWELTRTTDADTPSELQQNNSIFVTSGTVNTNTGWKLQQSVTQLNPLSGATNIVWVQYGGSQNIQAGAGLLQTGNTFDVVGTTNRITVGSSVDIAATYIGQSSITTVGTLLSLTVSGITTLNNTLNINGSAIVQAGKILTLTDQPTNNNDAANKIYVDSTISTSITNLVSGPGTGTLNAISRYLNGTTLKNSGVTIDDSNNITGIVALTASGNITGVNIFGTVSTPSQTSITTVGTLTTLVVSGTTTLNGAITINNDATISSSFKLTLTTQPTSNNHAANKIYVDNTIASAVLNLVTGPVSATSNTIARYSTNLTLKNSGVTIDDSNNITGVASLISTGNITGVNIIGNISTASQTSITTVGTLSSLVVSGTTTLNGALTINNDASVISTYRLTLLNQPTTNNHAANKIYVDNTVSSAVLNLVTGPVSATLNTIARYDTNLILKNSGVSIDDLNNITGVVSITATGTISASTLTATNIGGTLTTSSQPNIATVGTITSGVWHGSIIDVTYGGTGLADPASGNVLITNGSNPFSLKSNPSGAFVGTTDTQTLTNKILSSSRINTAGVVFANTDITTNTLAFDTSGLSAPRTYITPDTSDSITLNTFTQALTNKTLISNTNNILARGLWTNSGANSVSTYVAANPTSGQVLTATSATTATWQTPSTAGFNPARTIFVYQGAPNVSPNYSTLQAAISNASTLTPTASNPVMIQLFPGTYSETIPIVVPAFVGITGLSSSPATTIIRPVAPASATNILTLAGNTRIYGFVVECADGSGGYATIGILSSGNLGRIDIVSNMIVRNASTSCYRISGGGVRTGQVMTATTCYALVNIPSITVSIGFEIQQGGVLQGDGLIVTGFSNSGIVGTITTGYYAHDDYSTMIINSIRSAFCSTAIRVGGGTTSNSQIDYPTLRLGQADIGTASNIALYMDDKSVCNLGGFKLVDNNGFFPIPTHLYVSNPALPADPNILTINGSNIREDRVIITGATNNGITIRGLNLSEIPGDIKNVFTGNVGIGSISNGYEFMSGEGGARSGGLTILRAATGGTVFTDISTASTATISNPIAVNLATTAAINLTSAPATIDGVTPTSGVTRVLVKDGSTVNPGTNSVANGIYLWNGAGVAMTRTTDFAAGNSRSYQTWFAVDLGTVNYGSMWVINSATLTNTETIIVGTTVWGVTAQSSNAFPTGAVNNDALYIGSISPYQFPGVKLGITKSITTSSGTSSTVLAWEYWNGSIWTAIPYMSTKATSPYTNEVLETFAYGNTIISPAIYYQHVRFGNIASTWATTTINSVIAYWIRIRCVTAASISRIPIITNLKVHTNFTKINIDGYMEYFGLARAVTSVSVMTNALLGTGTTGEATTTQRLIFSASPVTTAINYTLNTFSATALTSLTYVWQPPLSIDTSTTIKVKQLFSQDTANTGNVALQIDYVFISPNDVVGNTTGTTTAVGRTSGIVVQAVSATAKGTFSNEMSLSITGFNPNTQYIIFKFSRAGADVSDTYASVTYLHNLSISYVTWSNGKYYS